MFIFEIYTSYLKKYHCHFYRRTALVFFIFLGLLSFAAVTGVTADDVTKCNQTIDYFRVIAEILVCIYAFLTFVGEIIQIVK